MKKETSAEQATDKTITMEHAKASADALLLPDELLSCRKAPNPLYAFLAETKSVTEAQVHQAIIAEYQ